jgi:hypothetical protein
MFTLFTKVTVQIKRHLLYRNVTGTRDQWNDIHRVYVAFPLCLVVSFWGNSAEISVYCSLLMDLLWQGSDGGSASTYPGAGDLSTRGHEHLVHFCVDIATWTNFYSYHESVQCRSTYYWSTEKGKVNWAYLMFSSASIRSVDGASKSVVVGVYRCFRGTCRVFLRITIHETKTRMYFDQYENRRCE